MNQFYAQPKWLLSCKKYIFLLLVFLIGSYSRSFAQTSLNPGDIAVIGFNTDKTPDDLVILILKDLTAGTVFYVNDNEVTTAGGTSFAELNEAEASFTVKAGQTITKGTVIVLPWNGGLTSTAAYDWNVTAGAGLGNAEEIYVYNATSVTSLTPTNFIFGVTQGANTGLIPAGLTAGSTWIDHGSSRAYRYNTTGATYTGTQAQLLTAIGNVANYTGAANYTFAAGDWTFTVTTPGGNPSVNLSVSAAAGTEAGTTAITVTATASAVVSGNQSVDLTVTGSGITAGDYTLSNTSIIIADGTTAGTSTFTVIDDALIEGTETATLTISNPSAGIVLGGTTQQSITITDNDLAVPHTLAFVRTDTTVTEAAGTVKVFLRVTAAGNTSGTIDLQVSNYSTATGAGTDYSVPVTVNVPANLVVNQLISFDFTINDDALAEADEYIICKIGNASNVTVSNTAQSTLYIKDNDKTTPVGTNQLSLNFISSFNNGAAGTNSAEISAYDEGSKRLFIANSVANKLDIVDLTNPAAPVQLTSINLGTAFNGAINSVDVHSGVVALALEGLTDKQANGKIVFTDINGGFISEVATGAMPDMITFNHAGTKVYTANEGEPNAAYSNDPVGSITIADITGGAASAVATTIDFTAYNGQEAALRAQGIRIYGLNATAAQDFEPEYITIADNDSTAWVTLQENNALAEINLVTNTIVKLIPLGYKDHSLPVNAFDVSDQTFGINLSTFPVKGMYLPDAIASYTSGNNVYLITANEGDARAYSGFNEESRVSGLTLDPTLFPNSAELKNNAVLGRLNATNKTGDFDNDGDIDEIYIYGSRSFSIWNPATSSQVYDSKDELERITANDPLYSQFFNMSNTVANTAIKNRSDDKGPEPEGVAVAKIGNRNYAFVALERIGGVVVYDVTNPAVPAYVTYKNSRTVAAGDRGSEGIIVIPAAQSPNGKSLVLLSNEVSSTVSVFEIAPCTAPGIASIQSIGGTTACAGNQIKLFNQNSSATYTYQWLRNDTLIAGATDSVYWASQSGNYKLVVFNASGCVDTSAVLAISIEVDQTAPTITAPADISITVAAGTTEVAVNLGTPVVSDNCGVASVTNNAPAAFPIGTTLVTWTATDSSGNTATATQEVVVAVAVNVTPVVAITSPSNPAAFNAGNPITIAINATDADGTIAKVAIYTNGQLYITDSIAPYSITAVDVEPGIYKVTAKATDNTGDFTISDTLTITVTGCEGSGTITGEGYTNINGGLVSDLTGSSSFPGSPSIVAALSSFEYENVTDNYGARVRGYICAPVTGDYIFHIAADDQAGLWLSTDENPANKVLIAYTEVYTGFREWYKYPTQTSVAVHLVKGARYYIETLHKESISSDHLSVGWTLPGGVFEGPIAGSRLSPIGSLFPNSTVVSGARAFSVAMQGTTTGRTGLKVTATPNPATAYFVLKTVSSSDKPLTIRVVDALGRVVETKAKISANGTIQIGERLPVGIYFVEVKQGENKETLKLIKR